jgi:hypothetical protein
MLRRRHVISAWKAAPSCQDVSMAFPVARSGRSFPASRNTEKAVFWMRHVRSQFTDVEDPDGEFACHWRWQATDNAGTRWPHGRRCARSTDARRRCVPPRISSGCGDAISNRRCARDSARSISPAPAPEGWESATQYVGKPCFGTGYTATVALIAGWNW